jgi:Ribbon-helix-helix protein, copG family
MFSSGRGLRPREISHIWGEFPTQQRKIDVSYVNYSIHLPDPKLLARIKAAAKAKGTTVSSFIRAAAEKAVEQHEKKQKSVAA